MVVLGVGLHRGVISQCQTVNIVFLIQKYLADRSPAASHLIIEGHLPLISLFGEVVFVEGYYSACLQVFFMEKDFKAL